MLPERYCVIDVETTGLRPTQDRIVEVACALVDGGRIVDRWATLVNPGVPIPQIATSVHGISDEMVARAPSVTWALRFVRRWCRGRTVAAHCANFDLSFVGPSVATRGLCTMRLARALFPEAPNHKNQTLRRFLAIDRAGGERFEAHRALGDALVSAHVLIACRRRFEAYRGGESWARFLAETAFVSVPAPHQSAVAERSLNAQRRFASAISAGVRQETSSSLGLQTNAVAARARRGISSPLEVAIE
jgi:DNA polymerase III subunit epsilon